MIDGNGNLTLSDHYKHELASFINFLLILCDINIFRTTKYTKADIDFEILTQKNGYIYLACILMNSVYDKL